MTDFTEEERSVISAALKNFVSRYRAFHEEVEAEAIRKALSERIGVAEETERKLDGSGGGGCLFIYVPDGIYDQELEDEFRSKVPEHPEFPDKKNVFWSSSYNNFVVRGHKKEAEEAIRERYGDGKVLVKEPKWASKPNTWQIVDEGDVDPSGR